VSLSKLKNKYFATRCNLGHVNIWSATTHPDRLFTIENIEKDEPSYMNENTPNQTKTDDEQNQSINSLPNSSPMDKMIELKWKL
jgi:hypothetical protein